MKQIATYQIHDVFKITGRGIVLLGIILDGENFLTGDFIEFDFDGERIRRKITGIDRGIKFQKGKPNVGILMETINENEMEELRNWNPNLTIGSVYTNR